MELSRLEIENYKSIKSPITFSFHKDLPTVLIGKNGSGKTNILLALNAIAQANSHYYGHQEGDHPAYRAFIQLSEDDVAALLPDIVYDKSRCEIIAYSTADNLKIDRIRSDSLVTFLKDEIGDIRDLASQLKEAVDQYEKQLIKISHDGYDELPIQCYKLYEANGGLTNFNILHHYTESFIKYVRQELDFMLRPFNDDEIAFTYAFFHKLYFGWNKHTPFRLEYVEPSLAKFEQKFVTINKKALKREITRINKVTKDSYERIDRLIKAIEDKTERLQNNLNTDIHQHLNQENRYDSFLCNVQQIIGRKCLFLKNENRDVLFQKESRDYYDYKQKRRDYIFETYLRHVYQGDDKEQLLKSSNKDHNLSEQAVRAFEQYLNEHIPDFDRKMYSSISVEAANEGQLSIYLHEKTGDRVNLNETSTGRRWYFSYYFMKNLLEKGDIFIIDEPAATLHPSAQKEILAELTELARKGVKVVYSTHSPYLIPEDHSCVHFVTMTEKGTEVYEVSSHQEMIKQMKDIIGNDIFDIQSLYDQFRQADPKSIARNCFYAITAINALDNAATDLNLSIDTIKSWNRKGEHFRSPKLENVLAVSMYTKKSLHDLLK